jgi:CDGSH-type Zn-finger protein
MTQDSLAQDSLINERREPAEAARIVVIHNGPYELDGSIALVDHLGIPVAAQAPVRLCRCGQSQTKPFCDDSHLRTRPRTSESRWVGFC